MRKTVRNQSLTMALIIMSATTWAMTDLNQEPEPIGEPLAATGNNKVYSHKALTPELLEQCVTDGLNIDDERVVLLMQQQEHIKQKQQLQQLAKEIKGSRYNPNNGQSVNDYNNKVAQYKSGIKLSNHNIEAWKAAVANYNNSILALNNLCAGKDFYQEDLNNILTRISQLPSIFNNLKKARVRNNNHKHML